MAQDLQSIIEDYRKGIDLKIRGFEAELSVLEEERKED
jgi:hypothetical protein